MDFLPPFFRPKARSGGKSEEEIEVPAPIAEGPAPERFVLPPAPAIIPRWRLERETAPPASTFPLPAVPAAEVTLTLDDVLPRVPTHALREGLHDPDLPLNFRANEFRSGLMQGRPAVVLSQLAERYPEVFHRPATPAEDTEVLLPARKVMQQVERAQVAALAALPPAPPLFPAAMPELPVLRRPEELSLAPSEVPGPVGVEVESEEPAVVQEPAPAPPAKNEAAAVPFPFVPPPIRILPGPPRTRAPLLSGPAEALAPRLELASEPAEILAEPELPAIAQAPLETATQNETEKAPESLLPQPGNPSTDRHSVEEPSMAKPVPVPVSERTPTLTNQPEYFLVDQEPLQAIFMTDEELDLPRVTELSASLPGVSGCMILTGDHLTQGGEKPAGLDAKTLRELSEKISVTLAGFSDRLPAEPNITLYGGNRALSLFSRPDLCLCVVHGPRGFQPGVRERLAAVADGLAEGLCSRSEQAELPL